MKRILAFLVTCLSVILIVKFAQRTPPAKPATLDTPIACVDRMFTAASRGDVKSYVNCFDGDELMAIRRSLAQESQNTAAESLRKTMSELRGWAIVDPPQDTSDSFQCSITVERIYSGRIDRQKMDMIRLAGRWKICRVDQAQPLQPPVPYGTPISGEPPKENG